MAGIIKPVICGGTKVTVPEHGCTDCDYLEARVEALEQMLAQYEEVELVKRDKEDRTVTVFTLGRVEVDEGDTQWTWGGLTPITVDVGEEFDPMDGVTASSSKCALVSLVLLEGGGNNE